MNWDRIEGNWKQMTGKLRQQWGKLTDDDFDKIDGRREELSGRIQEVYGISKDEAEKQIERFGSSFDSGSLNAGTHDGVTHTNQAGENTTGHTRSRNS
jgi:uncharacterized protein YjbJ (UPF0337 family)